MTLSAVALFVSVIAAAFTGWQALIARDSAKRQLRAYVHAMPVGEVLKVGEKVTVGVEFKNGGQTPAYNFSIATRAGMRALPEKTSVADLGPGPSKEDTKGPGFGDFAYESKVLTFTLPLSQPLTQAQHDAIANGSLRIFVWGRAEYTDAFDDRHYVRYCWSLSGQTLRTDYVQYCKDGNDAD